MKKTLLCFSAALLTLCGCVGSYYEHDNPSAKSDNTKILVIDDKLAEQLKVLHIVKQRTERGMTSAFVLFRVKRDNFFQFVFSSYKSMKIEYRFIWYDENGVEVPQALAQENGWKVVTLRPDDQLGCASLAPNSKVAFCMLYVKYADEPLKKKDSVVQTEVCETDEFQAKAAKVRQELIKEEKERAAKASLCGNCKTAKKMKGGALCEKCQAELNARSPKSGKSAAPAPAGVNDGASCKLDPVRCSPNEAEKAKAAKKAEAAPAKSGSAAPAPAGVSDDASCKLDPVRCSPNEAEKAKAAKKAAAVPAVPAGKCLCGCDMNPDAKCYCPESCGCPAAKKRAAQKPSKTVPADKDAAIVK